MKKFGFLLIMMLLLAGTVFAHAEETQEAASAEAETGEESEELISGRTNRQVHLRKEPSSSSVALSVLEKGTNVSINQSKSTDDFLYVRCFAAYGKEKAWLEGYIQWDYVDVTEEKEDKPEEPALPGHTNNLVRLRKEPFSDAVTLSKVSKGTKVYIYESVSTQDYYYVRCYTAYGGGTDWITGYIMRKYVDLDEPEEAPAEEPAETAQPEAEGTEESEQPASAETEAPAVTSVASAGIGFGDDFPELTPEQKEKEKELGPAKAGHTNNLVRVRKEPSADSVTMAKLASGTRVFIYPSAAENGFQFVKCFAVSGSVRSWVYGYIMDKYVDADEDTAETAPEMTAPEGTPGPREEPAGTDRPEEPEELGEGRQGRTTASVRVRKEADPKSMAVARLGRDAVVTIYDEKSTDDYWYVKCYGGKAGWVRGYLLKEYVNASEAVAVPVEEIPEDAPLKQGRTTAEVRLRQDPASYSPTVSVLKKNTDIWVDETKSTEHYWFAKCYASYFEGDEDWVTGYVLKEYTDLDGQ